MKLKILFLATALFIIAPRAFAEDCMHDPIVDRDWNAVITTGARVRNIPCMETSTVLGTVPTGEVVHVIGETDGYYKIETAKGIVGWSGQWLMAATDQSFNVAPAPAPAPTTDSAPSANSCGNTGILTDICGHAYETAIRYLFEHNIVSGYADGSFKPDQKVNRAEFVKIIVASALQYDPGQDPSGFDIYAPVGLSFSDALSGAWYIPFLRKAVQNELINGYPDGTFKPGRTINLTEAAKILSKAHQLPLGDSAGAWYKPYVEALQGQSAIPMSLKTLNQSVTRGEMAEMIWRIMEKVQTQPFRQFEM